MRLNNTYTTSQMADSLKIRLSILKLYPFTDEQLNQFVGRLTFKTFKKKSFLIKPNEVSNCLTFINRGSFRFYTNTAQRELTINFFTENQWVADIDSFLTQQPCKNYIEACENSDVASITLANIHQLMDIYPCFRMLNGLVANFAISTNHLVTISTKNPDMGYKELLTKHPDWINRFPQMQIASYLGITPETLSRVRARIA